MHPSLFWLYDIPNWLFGTIVITFFPSCALIALFTTRKWVRRQHRIDHSHNDIVSAVATCHRDWQQVESISGPLLDRLVRARQLSIAGGLSSQVIRKSE